VLDATMSVETPEQVMLTYTLAGFGSRAVATVIDTLIIGILMFGITVAFSVLVGDIVGPHIATDQSRSWAIALVFFFEFALFWAYYVGWEALHDGQTPGKRLLNLRVVQEGGYSVTFAASAVRNLLRIIDMQPGFTYLVGSTSMLVTTRGRRLGDLVAGTFVVHEGKRRNDAVTAPVAGAVAAAQGPMLTPRLRDQEFDVLERLVARLEELEPEAGQRLVRQLAKQWSAHLDADALNNREALIDLFKRERRARMTSVAGRSDTGTQRERHAIVALGMDRWTEFGTMLDAVRRSGLRTFTPVQVSDFVERYRQLTADLARLQTASRGQPSDAMFFVGRLVAGGHAVLYRRRVRAVATTLRYLGDTIPRELRRSGGYIALAALLFFGPGITAYVVAASNPKAAATFVPPVMFERAEHGRDNLRRHKGYIDVSPAERPIMASQIIANNVKIAYAAFAFGITAGIGTILMLVLNGVMIGGGMGVFAAKGVSILLWAFVAPHGVLELSAICIAGGAGLLIGSAFVLPGEMTRRDALVDRGRRAITLVAAATLFLLVAGTIEGLISPRVWPIQWKVAVSIATAVAMLTYLSLGWLRRNPSAQQSERGAVL